MLGITFKKFCDIRNTKNVDVIAPITDITSIYYAADPQAVRIQLITTKYGLKPKNLMRNGFWQHMPNFWFYGYQEYKNKTTLYDVKEFWVIM
jgi:hypothetical protein